MRQPCPCGFRKHHAVDDNDDNAYGRRVQMLLHGNEKNGNDTSGWDRYRLEP